MTFDRISISPFPITNLFDSVVDPDPLSTSSVWDLDPFTQMLWKHHEDAVKRGNLKTLFGTKSLCPDSYLHPRREGDLSVWAFGEEWSAGEGTQPCTTASSSR